MYGKMKASRLIEMIPFTCISAFWGQYPVFSHPQSVGSGGRYSPFWIIFRAHQLTPERCRHWWLWHPSLLIWQEILHFTYMLVISLGAGDTVLNKASNITAFHCGACIVMKDSQAAEKVHYEWGLSFPEMSALKGRFYFYFPLFYRWEGKKP